MAYLGTPATSARSTCATRSTSATPASSTAADARPASPVCALCDLSELGLGRDGALLDADLAGREAAPEQSLVDRSALIGLQHGQQRVIQHHAIVSALAAGGVALRHAQSDRQRRSRARGEGDRRSSASTGCPAWPPASSTAASSSGRRGPGFADVASRRSGDTGRSTGSPRSPRRSPATAIMQLRDEGRLHLDDPVVAHLPELRARASPFGAIETVTIRRLLSHESGLMGDPPGTDWSEPMYEGDPAANLARAAEIGDHGAAEHAAEVLEPRLTSCWARSSLASAGMPYARARARERSSTRSGSPRPRSSRCPSELAAALRDRLRRPRVQRRTPASPADAGDRGRGRPVVMRGGPGAVDLRSSSARGGPRLRRCWPARRWRRCTGRATWATRPGPRPGASAGTRCGASRRDLGAALGRPPRVHHERLLRPEGEGRRDRAGQRRLVAGRHLRWISAEIATATRSGGPAADRAAGAAPARVGAACSASTPTPSTRCSSASSGATASSACWPTGEDDVAADAGADADARPVRGQPGRPRVRRAVRLPPAAGRPRRVDDGRHHLAAPARPGRRGLTGPLSRRRSGRRRRRSRPAPTPAPTAHEDRTSCRRPFAARPAARRRPGGREATRRTRRPG